MSKNRKINGLTKKGIEAILLSFLLGACQSPYKSMQFSSNINMNQKINFPWQQINHGSWRGVCHMTHPFGDNHWPGITTFPASQYHRSTFSIPGTLGIIQETTTFNHSVEVQAKVIERHGKSLFTIIDQRELELISIALGDEAEIWALTGGGKTQHGQEPVAEIGLNMFTGILSELDHRQFECILNQGNH